MSEDSSEVSATTPLQENAESLQEGKFSWRTLKESFKRFTPEQAAAKVDILGRINNLAYNPETAKWFMQALDIGVLGAVMTGLVAPELVPIVSQSPMIAKAMTGIAPETSHYLPAKAKVVNEAVGVIAGPNFVQNITEVLGVMPHLKVREKARKAAGAIDIFMSNMNRLKIEKQDAMANSKLLNQAANAFGTQLPALAG